MDAKSQIVVVLVVSKGGGAGVERETRAGRSSRLRPRSRERTELEGGAPLFSSPSVSFLFTFDDESSLGDKKNRSCGYLSSRANSSVARGPFGKRGRSCDAGGPAPAVVPDVAAHVLRRSGLQFRGFPRGREKRGRPRRLLHFFRIPGLLQYSCSI